MVGPLNLRDLVWSLTFLLKLTLLFFIFWQRVYRLHPVFSAYVLLTVLQTALTALSLWRWGAQSAEYFGVAWGAQAVVLGARWLAVAEIARRAFAAYPGIRKLSTTALYLLGMLIVIYSIALSPNRWDWALLHAVRAVELCIAVFIVAMLLFAKYYRLALTSLERQLAIGFCLFSCSWVVTNSIFQSPRHPTGIWFEFSQILAFLATLLVWLNAVRKPVEVPQPAPPSALSPGMYGELSQQLDIRLRELNDRLSHLLHSKDSHP